MLPVFEAGFEAAVFGAVLGVLLTCRSRRERGKGFRGEPNQINCDWPVRRTPAPARRRSLGPAIGPAGTIFIHRAYELWEQAGKPEGRDQEFYHQAEKELQAEPTEEIAGDS